MRTGLTSYGDSAFSLFLRKAFIKGAGYSDDALDRPIVGIANTASAYNPCHGNAAALVEAVSRGIMLNGGLPMPFPTISIHESFAHPTSMYLRNLMAMDTEEMIRAQPMDSVIVIGGCDKTLPAQVMAANSADLPTVVIPVGPMVVGHHKGEVLGACTDCRRMWGKFRAGEIDQQEIDDVNARLAPSVGTCMVMGTASTMACITEAMGLSLPMSATIPAPHAERFRLAEASGRVAAVMAKAKGPRPGELLTESAFRNAQVVLQAIGGSTNGLIHLTAMAHRSPHRLDLGVFDQIGREVPVLVDLKPSGEHYMEHFHHAGGVPKLLAQLGVVAPFPHRVDRLVLYDDRPAPRALAEDAVDRQDELVYHLIATPLYLVWSLNVHEGGHALTAEHERCHRTDPTGGGRQDENETNRRVSGESPGLCREIDRP